MAADLDPLCGAEDAELAGYVDSGIWELEEWLLTLVNPPHRFVNNDDS